MGKQTVTIETSAAEGDKVLVLNYKLRPPRWETGTVRNVECGIRRDGTYRLAYDVILDRQTSGRSRMFPDGGGPLRLTVGDDDISQI